MNKEFVEVDGKLIVSDESGHLKIEDASDLSKEILRQENRRRQELDLLETYADQKVKYDNFKGKYIPIWLYGATAATLIAPPIALAMTGANPITTTFETIFGPMNLNLLMTGITGAFSIPFASLLTYLEYQTFKSKKEKWNYANDQYNVHRKKFDEEARKLDELLVKSDTKESTSSDKPKIYAKTFRVQKVDE